MIIVIQDRDDGMGHNNKSIIANKPKNYEVYKYPFRKNKIIRLFTEIFHAIIISRKSKKIFFTNLKSECAFFLNFLKNKNIAGIYYHIEGKDYLNFLSNYKIFSTSKDTVDYIKKRGHKKVSLIYQGISSEFKFKDKKRDIDVLYVGTKTQRKNWNHIKKVYDKMNKETRYNMVLQTNNNLSLKELSDLYQRSKFLFFPTRLEGLGLPLIEASFSGCNIITSNLDHHRFITLNQANYTDINNSDFSYKLIKKLLKKYTGPDKNFYKNMKNKYSWKFFWRDIKNGY